MQSSATTSIADRLKRVWARPVLPDALRRALEPRRALLADVGARGGAHVRWSPFVDVMSVLAFDADADSIERAPNVEIVPIALGTLAAERTLHLCRLPGCSSLLRPNARALEGFPRELTRSFDVVGTRTVSTRPLDDVLRERRARPPDFLKLDVQGAELEILESAPRALEHAKLIEVEVELIPLYEAQPLFGEVHAFLTERGLTLLGLRRSSWRRADATGHAHGIAGGQLVHADALYLSSPRFEAPLDARELAAWAVGLSAYRQHDSLASLLTSRRAIDAIGAPSARALLDALAPRRRAGFRIASRALARVHRFHHLTLRQWAAALRVAPASDWHDPDFY